jgi:hypothetical protein
VLIVTICSSNVIFRTSADCPLRSTAAVDNPHERTSAWLLRTRRPPFRFRPAPAVRRMSGLTGSLSISGPAANHPLRHSPAIRRTAGVDPKRSYTGALDARGSCTRSGNPESRYLMGSVRPIRDVGGRRAVSRKPTSSTLGHGYAPTCYATLHVKVHNLRR